MVLFYYYQQEPGQHARERMLRKLDLVGGGAERPQSLGVKTILLKPSLGHFMPFLSQLPRSLCKINSTFLTLLNL